MAVDATTYSTMTITPDKARYSFMVNCINDVVSGRIILQRAQHNEDGTWLDDPTPGNRKIVDLVKGDACTTLLSYLGQVVAACGFTTAYTDYRIQANGSLDLKSNLMVSLTFQLKTADGWKVVRVNNLYTFLAANLTLAAQLTAAWDAYDAALSAANKTNKWI